MKKITKFFIFLLLFVSLAGNLLNLGIWQRLKESSEAWDKRNLHHWLSIQSRVEDLEEAAQVFGAEDGEKDETIAEPPETTVEETTALASEPVTEASAE